MKTKWRCSHIGLPRFGDPFLSTLNPSSSFNLPTSSLPTPTQKQKSMASTCAVSMAVPKLTHKTTALPNSNSTSFFNPLSLRLCSSKSVGAPAKRLVVQSSLKEKAVTGLTAAALTASMVVPDVAQAASGITPSLNNFLLSIGAGGAVLVAILGAVIGVSNFDPVKRG